jgi:hypothetical protein
MQRVGLRGMLDLTELSAWEIHFKSWIRDNPVAPSLPDEKKSIFLKQFAYLLAGKLPTLGHNPLQIG